MAVILNETKQAESIIQNGTIGNKPASTLFLLGKYYKQKTEFDQQQIFCTLNSFMHQHYPNYNPALWENLIEDICKKANKYPLRELDFIGITQSELDAIATADSLKYQQLLFTMLCYAKLYNMISPDNNGWVNASIPEIYRTSRVIVKYKNDKFLYLHDLETAGLISFSCKNDNLNIRINFTDMLGETVLKITDLREPGYEYLNYIGAERFIRCLKCGRLVRRSGTNTRYCPSCKKEKRLEEKRTWWKTHH